MTQHNVVLPDAVPLPAQPPPNGAANPSAYSSRRPPRGRVLSTTGVGQRSYLRQLDVAATAGRMGAWVEAMKASSPTHVAGTLANDNSGWMSCHPSALDMFEEIAGLAKGKQVAIFLDYDGTLSPIVDDPDKAFMTDAMRDAVRNLAGCFPTAIVTGRSIDKVFGFVQLEELYYAGSHGMDIKGPSHNQGANEVLFQPASRFIPMINEMHSLLLKATRGIPGAKVENNKFCLSVHFRRVDEKLWGRLEEQVRQLVVEFPDLRLTRGRKVLEIRPVIEWDKGKALLFLLNTLGFDNRHDILPIYIGDDRTDEDAFKVLRDMGRGFGVVVSKIPKETNASYTLQEPSEVMEFLGRLVGWKCLKQPQMTR